MPSVHAMLVIQSEICLNLCHLIVVLTRIWMMSCGATFCTLIISKKMTSTNSPFRHHPVDQAKLNGLQRSITSKHIQQDVFKVLFSLELIPEKMVPWCRTLVTIKKAAICWWQSSTQEAASMCIMSCVGGVTCWIHEHVPCQQMVQA